MSTLVFFSLFPHLAALSNLTGTGCGRSHTHCYLGSTLEDCVSGDSTYQCCTCNSGTYTSGGPNNLPGQTCQACPSSTYLGGGGLASCLQCAAGHPFPLPSRWLVKCSCTRCYCFTMCECTFECLLVIYPLLAGSYCPAGSPKQVPCAPGTWSDNGAEVCSNCTLGTFASIEGGKGAGSCSLCPPGEQLAPQLSALPHLP